MVFPEDVGSLTTKGAVASPTLKRKGEDFLPSQNHPTQRARIGGFHQIIVDGFRKFEVGLRRAIAGDLRTRTAGPV